jgi:hypothetical protein
MKVISMKVFSAIRKLSGRGASLSTFNQPQPDETSIIALSIAIHQQAKFLP